MKRKIIIGVILAFLLLFTCGILYLNNVFLPVKVKKQLSAELSAYLNYNVEIAKLKYSPLKGIIVQNIIVYDKVKDKDNTILTIKEASFHILFLPLLKERKIIIPIMHVDSPSMNIRYHQDNSFNFSRVFIPKPKAQVKPQTQSKAKPPTKSSFFIYKINIFGASIAFEDEHMTPKFTRTLQNMDIVLGLRQFTKIGFLVEGKTISGNQGASTFSVKGNYNLISKEATAKINITNLILTEFASYLKSLPLSIASGSIDNAALDVNYKNDTVSLKGTISANDLILRKADLMLTGNISFQPELVYSIDKKTLDYKGNVNFVSAGLSGVQYVDKINNISGNVGFVKNKIWMDGLKFQVLDSDCVLKGMLENPTKPYINFILKSQSVNLQKILSVLPFKHEGTDLIGTAAAEIDIDGFIGRPQLDIKASLLLNDAKLQTAFLKDPINNIQGKIDFTPESANWSNLSFDFLTTAYKSTGKIVDFHSPEINFTLNSKDLELNNNIKIKDKSIRVVAFAGKYLNSKFNIEGSVDTQDKSNPSLDLLVNEISLYPEDTFVFLPASLSENLKKIKPVGILNFKGTIAGNAKDFRKWNVSLKCASDVFSVYDFKLRDISFAINQNDGLLSIDRFFAGAYSGSLSFNSIFELKTDNPVYSVKLHASGIDLAQLKVDAGIKDKDLSGILDINGDLSGNFKDLGALKGNAVASVKNGNLWQINLFKGLGELFLLPDYGKIVFKEALGEFDIANKAIATNNLRLTSEQLNLECKGKLGFDGALDFTFYSQANKSLIRDSTDLRKFTAAIMGNLSSALTVRVSGTIQKPKYKIVPVAVDVIRNIKDFLLGK